MKRLEIPEFYVHEKILRTQYCQNLPPENCRENL